LRSLGRRVAATRSPTLTPPSRVQEMHTHTPDPGVP
jgi:hypothetical protein